MKNFSGMMKQAQELQTRMAEMQAEMERARVEGQSGGGLVVLTLNGKGELVGVKIDASWPSPRRSRSSKTSSSPPMPTPRPRSRRLLQEKMQSLTGGLPLPPGLKLF